MTTRNAAAVLDGAIDRVPSWEGAERLCPDEPFGGQPAAAFCSGVLVGSNLVLTAEHCLGFHPLEEVRVAFGYYFLDVGVLAMSSSDVHQVQEVLVKASDASDNVSGDFAWLRLSDSVDSGRAPAPLLSWEAELELGAPIISVGAGGGVPIKLDLGGRVLDLGEEFWIADTDTFRGSSGGGAFNARGELIGIFAKGTSDFELTGNGCKTTKTQRAEEAREHFTYVDHALERLCRVYSVNPPCEEGPAPPDLPAASCALVIGRRSATETFGAVCAGIALGAVMALSLRRRKALGDVPRQKESC